MNILLVYPKYPDTYWSFKHALRFISKKAAVPPLGLITASAMLPGSWNKKLVDLNVSPLLEKDIHWADYVFISAMFIQRESVNQVISTCKQQDAKIVAGGPLFTQEYLDFPQIDHFILNEAEITLPLFLEDLEAGGVLKKVYKTEEYADLTLTPVPDYHLLSRKDYASMNLQVTRGCPFACDFCEITTLLGRRVRMKDTDQVIRELQALYDLKWRGSVAIVDDNLIGNKKQLRYSLLPAMINWMKEHKHPFTFSAQTSINLADDDDLMSLLTQAGFSSTFIGIETPDEKCLIDCKKVQNNNRDLLQSVKNIQHAGLQVSGGFIVGFDSDSPTIFQRQIEFIQQSGIVSAMVGLLNAPKNTALYLRLKEENRLLSEASGSNTDFSMNFLPKMNHGLLLEGYRSIIKNIYSAKPYYQRVRQFFNNYERDNKRNSKINFMSLKALFKSLIVIGIINRGRIQFWKFILWTLFTHPELFSDAITFSVYGYHFRTVYGLRH
jgi:radical SAM superfamily enzyme YgiQ (UPF0313 family)